MVDRHTALSHWDFWLRQLLYLRCKMNKVIINNFKEYSVLVVVVFLVVIYRSWDIITLDSTSMALEGDGIGTVVWLGILKDHFENGIIEYFTLSELWHPDFGMGLMAPAVAPGFALKLFMLPFFFLDAAPYNIYNYTVMAFYVVSAVSFYGLLRIFGIRALVAFIVCLFIVEMENFSMRAGGHMTFVAPFGFTIQLLFVYLAAKKRLLRHHLLLGVATWLSFQSNEYYGFYGTVLSCVFYLVYTLNNHNWSQLKHIIINVFASFFVFVLFMTISYQDIFLGFIGFGEHEANSIVNTYRYHIDELKHYSVNNPLELFFQLPAETNPHEFTFYIGSNILYVIALSSVAIFFLKIKKMYVFTVEQTRLLFATMAFGIIASLIGLNPEYNISLSEYLFQIAPMFRVVSRIYIFVAYAFFIILAFNIECLLRCLELNKFNSFLKHGYYLLIMLLLMYSMYGVSYLKFERFDFLHLPISNEENKVLKELGKEPLLILPFFGPESPPHENYNYQLNWLEHRLGMLNAPFNRVEMYNEELYKKLKLFSADLEEIDSELIGKLRYAGVKYLYVKCGYESISVKESNDLKIIYSDGCNTIYGIESEIDYDFNWGKILESYDVIVADKSLRINAEDCDNVVVSANKLEDQNDGMVLRIEVINGSYKNWGHQAQDIKIGAILFPDNVDILIHSNSISEFWYDINSNVKSGDTIIEKIHVPVNKFEEAKVLVISVLQPGNLWCHYAGQQPVIFNINQ